MVKILLISKGSLCICVCSAYAWSPTAGTRGPTHFRAMQNIMESISIVLGKPIDVFQIYIYILPLLGFTKFLLTNVHKFRISAVDIFQSKITYKIQKVCSTV